MDQMDCGYCTTKRKKTTKKIHQPLPDNVKCAERTCSTIIQREKLPEWRAAMCGKYIYRFCTQECWSKWLQDVQPNQSIIQFGSPNTPAIEPRSVQNDIAMLNI